MNKYSKKVFAPCVCHDAVSSSSSRGFLTLGWHHTNSMEVMLCFFLLFYNVWKCYHQWFNCIGYVPATLFTPETPKVFWLKHLTQPSIGKVVSRWWVHFHFSVNYPFNVRDKILVRLSIIYGSQCKTLIRTAAQTCVCVRVQVCLLCSLHSTECLLVITEGS